MTFDQWHARCCRECDVRCEHKEWERTAWEAAVFAERARCAKVAESKIVPEPPGRNPKSCDPYDSGHDFACEEIAAAIRSGVNP
jgi:hypothetical protein